MFCPACGGPTPDKAGYCPECGVALNLSAAPRGRNVRKFAPLICGAALLAVIFVMLALVLEKPRPASSGVESPSSGEASPLQPAVKPTGASEEEPENSGDVIHPFDLVKNPFLDKGKMVTLDSLPFPILVNDALVGYQSVGAGAAAASGIEGLHFNRMLSDNVCLFDVMAMDDPDYSDPQVVGQLAVIIRTGAGTPDDTRDWRAEPMGTIEGTNVYGAAVQVPAVRFWSYGQVPAVAHAMTRAPLTGGALEAVTFVQTRVRPTAAFLAEDPDIGHAEWSALNNSFVCEGCWYVSAHIQIHSGDEGPVQYFENPGWSVNLKAQSMNPDPNTPKLFANAPPGGR